MAHGARAEDGGAFDGGCVGVGHGQGSRIQGQDEFAAHLAAFEQPVRLLDLVDGENAVHHGPEGALGDALEDLGERSAGPHGGAEHRLVLHEQVRKRHVDLRAGGAAAGHEPPAPREDTHGAAPRGGPDVLEDDVTPVPLRERLDALGPVRVAVVEDLVRAELHAEGPLLLAARGRDHARAAALAIWIPAEPTPDAAPRTSTVSPAFSSARVWTMPQAVRKTSGTAAAWTMSTPSGIAVT